MLLYDKLGLEMWLQRGLFWAGNTVTSMWSLRFRFSSCCSYEKRTLSQTRRSSLSVCVCVSVQSCQSFCGEDEGFCGEDEGFCGKDEGFFGEDERFFIFLCLCQNPSYLPQCLSMCRHTNEGIPSTEHVQMLHWACADIIMRGNPVTDMTDNTETQTQTDSVYTLGPDSQNYKNFVWQNKKQGQSIICFIKCDKYLAKYFCHTI